MFKSLKTANFIVTDLSGTRQWYSNILGSQPVFETSDTATFKIGDCWLNLSRADNTFPACPERMFCFWDVDDIDIAYRRLIEAGAAPHMPVTQIANITFARVIDPFGNVIGITHTATNAKEHSIDNKPSQTAMMTALCRALAARDNRLTPHGPDTLAELFLAADIRNRIGGSGVNECVMKNFVPSWLYGYLIARTAFFDDHFSKALLKNIPQIVLLGAGYDTRAYRFKNILKYTKIFEMDADLTQKRKRAILNDANIEIPSQVSYVSVDFKIDNILDKLKKSGFNDSEETLFIWEGVTYYLSRETIMSTLNCIREHVPQGSTLCLDYMTDKIDSANPGEPCLFWITPSEIDLFLKNYGIKIIEHIDSNEMERQYLTLSDGSSAEKLLPNFRFIYGMF